MLRFTLTLLLAVAAAQAHAACGRQSDFLVRSDTSLAPVRPADCSTVTQSPPEFSWPPQTGENTYTVTVTLPGGKSETRKTTANWILWDRPLPPGAYTWRVNSSGSSEQKGEPRTFVIAPDAVAFTMPAPEAMYARAIGTPRPRTWSGDPTRPLGAARAERAGGFSKMVREVDDKMPAPVQAEPMSGSVDSNYEDTTAEQKRTLAAALAWATTRQKRYGADATRRLLAQAAWNTEGTLSYKTNDMGSRNVAWSLALGYDWLHDYLDEAQKKVIREAIRVRVKPMYEDMARLSGYPYDSHGNVTLTIVGAIGALMAGEFPEAERWVKETIPQAVVWTSPWGWRDGGFANGTSQMFWDTGSNLPAWNVLRNVTGVDLANKEWVRNHARFLAYFAPPGAPSGVFGDGHELALTEVAARVAKALAQFAPTPLGRWYAASLQGEDDSRLELLLAPRKEAGAAPLPPGTPDSAYFPSVGWVAMHSKLAEPQRTSVYFKSSPYGSYNHSHGDQNGFVIHHQGERLLAGSGSYDAYHSPHWKEWYKQTRASNGITFDGGQGQGFNDRKFSGEITRFASFQTHDYAVGRAEAAYGGALSRALRAVVYMRPNVVVIYDSLVSQTPRTWEWNMHTPGRMTAKGDTRVHVKNGKAQACVERVAGPDVAFQSTEQYPVAPQGKKIPRESHGIFATTQKSTHADFVTIVHVGSDCSTLENKGGTKKDGDGWRVDLAARSLRLSGDEVVLR